MIKIKKRFFQPIWKCDEIEDELTNLEENGWRLSRIKGFRHFEFVESKPKQVRYFFTYYMAKEKSNMLHIDNILLKKFKANHITGRFWSGVIITNIFRITNTDELDLLRIQRDIVLRRYLFKNFILGILVFLLLSLLLLIGAILNFEKLLNDVTALRYVFFAIIFILNVGYSIYNFIGFIYMKKKCKR